MISKIISRADKPSLQLHVQTKIVDLDFPNSAEEMRQALIEHLMHCQHCMAALGLDRDASLAEAGCASCKQLFWRLESELQVQHAFASSAHVSEDAIEEYCFHRLSDQECARFEQHLRVCQECAQQVGHRREFMQCLKAALHEWAAEKTAAHILNGVLGIHAPELDLSLCGPIFI